MGYALKLGGEIIPLTRYFSPEELLSTSRNTVNFETLPDVQQKIYKLFSTGNSPQKATEEITRSCAACRRFPCRNFSYSNLFRVIILKFYDAYDFDVRGVKNPASTLSIRTGASFPSIR